MNKSRAPSETFCFLNDTVRHKESILKINRNVVA